MMVHSTTGLRVGKSELFERCFIGNAKEGKGLFHARLILESKTSWGETMQAD